MENTKTELLELVRRKDLLGAALMLGRIHDARFDVEIYRDRVLELASRVWQRLGRGRQHDTMLKAEEVARVLFVEYGFAGKSDRSRHLIDDPFRHYLHTTLDRKTGSSLAMAVLYLVTAAKAGVEGECIALPSQYLVRIRTADGEFYVDAFDSGKILSREEFQRRIRTAMSRTRLSSTSVYEELTLLQIVARLVQQLKNAYVLKGSALEALRAVELLTALFPQSPELTRDRGILYCEIEYFSKAVQDLHYYLEQRPNATDVREIRKLTSMLKGYREIVN